MSDGMLGKIHKVPYALLTYPDKDFVEELVQEESKL
jgi:hypothetical protein